MEPLIALYLAVYSIGSLFVVYSGYHNKNNLLLHAFIVYLQDLPLNRFMRKYLLLLLIFLAGIYTDSVAATSWLNGWDRVPAILARIVPPVFPAKNFDITAYGAASGGTTLCTSAIDAAITACHNAGGGRVVVPAGIYLTGAIHLQSNVNLYISKGATLKFSANPADYLPVVFTRYEGTECYNYSPFIYAYAQTNIAITGSGTVDGCATLNDWWAWKTTGDADRTSLMAMGQNNTPLSQRVFGTGHYLRPVFIQPHSCTNVLIDSITLLNSTMWEINPVLCQNVTVSNVTISSHGVNNDGCDPDCSKDVLIKNCTFDTGDDCIAIKSGRNNDGRRVNVSSENIVIQGCIMKDGHGGVVLGSEISGSVRNVFAENCAMNSTALDRMLRIKTNSVRGGTIENIFLRNIQVLNVASEYIQVDMYYEEGDAGTFTPVVQNICVENITGNATTRVFNANCYVRSPVTNILLKNSNFAGTTIGTLTNVRKLQVDNSFLNGAVPLLPTVSSSYNHAERYAAKTNWGWSDVYTGFSGNGYMEPTDSVNSIQYTITTTRNEQDSITWTYANTKTTDVTCQLYLDGKFNQTLVFKPTTTWSSKKTGLNLPTGTNTVQLVSLQGTDGVFLDKFTVTYISPFTALNTVCTDNSLNIFPTVVREQARIHFTPLLQYNSTLTIYNMKGEKVLENTLEAGTVDFIFNRNELLSGVYLLQLQNSQGISVIKFVLE
jgi:polygalacturonase